MICTLRPKVNHLGSWKPFAGRSRNWPGSTRMLHLWQATDEPFAVEIRARQHWFAGSLHSSTITELNHAGEEEGAEVTASPGRPIVATNATGSLFDSTKGEPRFMCSAFTGRTDTRPVRGFSPVPFGPGAAPSDGLLATTISLPLPIE